MTEREEIKGYLIDIKKAADGHLKSLDILSDEEIRGWSAHFSQVLQDVSYPDL